MSHRENLERRADIINRVESHSQKRHGDSQAGARTSANISIALTREAGVPGTTIAREVGQILGWKVYDHELLELIAKEMGLRTNLLESLDERRQSWLLESVHALQSAKVFSESSYVHHLIQTILSLGAHGHCVIVGRGAALILPHQFTLRVRLVGEREDRIRKASQRFHLSHEAAARWVQEKDRERMAFMKDHFLKDPTDPINYDLMLNTTTWSEAECAEFCVRGVRALEARVANQGTATGSGV
jgi:cytidylate kinase